MKQLSAAMALLLTASLPVHAAWAAEPANPLKPCLRKGEKPPPKTKNMPPWGVEIVTDFSRKAALADFGQMQKRHGRALGDASPIVVPTCDLTRGTHLLYSVRIGQSSRKAAADYCKSLQSKGLACIVRKN
jgi:SPOR domain